MASEHADLFADLAAPFSLDELEWRVGATTGPADKSKPREKGMVLVYVTNRAVMDRLDAVVGPENWKVRFELGRGKSVLCYLSLRIGGEWIEKCDGAEETETEPVKGGLSSAMKRAAVMFSLGRYLYEIPDQWAPIEQAGRSYRFPRDFRPSIPARFLPSGSQPPASRPAPSPKPKDETKRQQAKPQAAVEPGPPPFWDDPVGTGFSYFDLTWRQAFERDQGEFVSWLESIVDEVLEAAGGDRAKARKMATDKEKQISAAYAYLTKGGSK
jgi:hypothetical protein